ncbi:hypothetical protein ABPG77_009183 [Micractinium sp. CCAP 211/92]
MAGPSRTSDIPDFVRNNVFVVCPVYAGEEHGTGTAFLLHEDYTYLGHRILLTNRHCIIPSTFPGPDGKPKSEAHELADKYKALGIVPNDTPPEKVYIYRSCDDVSPHRVPFEAKWATFDDARIKMFKTASGDREGHLDLAVLYFDTPPAGLDLKGLEGFKFGRDMPQGTKAITCGFGTDTAGNAFKSKCFTVNEIQTCLRGQGLPGNATDLAGSAGTAYDYFTEPGLAKGHSGGPVFDDAAYQEGDFSPDLTMRRFEPYPPTSA